MGKVLRSRYRTMKLKRNKVSDSSLNTTLNGSVLNETEEPCRCGVVTPSSGGRPSCTPSRRYRYTPVSRSGRVPHSRRFLDDIFTPSREPLTPCHSVTPTHGSRRLLGSLNGTGAQTQKCHSPPAVTFMDHSCYTPKTAARPSEALNEGFAYTPSAASLMYTPKAVGPVVAPWIYCSTPHDPGREMWNFLARCEPQGEVWTAIIGILKRMEGTCLELALEGERLCKAGDCRTGAQFFEAAVQVGTDDLQTLGAIYSQLGNAYFYLNEYGKALEYHKHDLNLTRAIGDRLGEAKASGNLGNTLKVLGKYEEAIVCCQRHLDMSRELNDKIGEARALYNLANVYHTRGKHLGQNTRQDPGEFPPEVKESLQKAAQYYEENLALVRQLGDRAAEGRACGNLGNTYYLLARFQDAIKCHEERLSIAKEFGDKSAERRANSNLGNTYIFLGQFEKAAKHYKRTLQLARQLADRALEAQACYSLGNTYTLLQDFDSAIKYHMLHLEIAQELNDKIGECRACWSLGNAYTALNLHEEAVQYAARHLKISKEIGDETGKLTAQLNLSELKEHLGIALDVNSDRSEGQEGQDGVNKIEVDAGICRPSRMRRSSMEHMEILRFTPDKKEKNGARPKPPKVQKAATVATDLVEHMIKKEKPDEPKRPSTAENDKPSKEADILEEENFLDLLSKFQGRRIDDQRCSVRILTKQEDKSSSSSSATSANQDDSENKENTRPHNGTDSAPSVEFLDLVAGIQGSRMNDQRASLPEFPGLHNKEEVIGQYIANRREETALDDQFFEMLMRCQGSRIDDQRTSLPEQLSAPTVPDEDFFSLIQRVQSDRLDEQRSKMPNKKPAADAASTRKTSSFPSSSLSNPLKKGSKKDKKQEKQQ